MTSTATSSGNRLARHLSAFLLLMLAAAFLFAVAPGAHAQDPFGLQETYGGIRQKGSFIRDPAVLIGNIVKIALGLVGTVFFLLMLYAGFLWMTARGAQDTVKKAKDMISAAIIGLVIVSAAYAVSNFVIQGVSEPDVVLPTSLESDDLSDLCDETRSCGSSAQCGGKYCNPTTGKCECEYGPEGPPPPPPTPVQNCSAEPCTPGMNEPPGGCTSSEVCVCRDPANMSVIQSSTKMEPGDTCPF